MQRLMLLLLLLLCEQPPFLEIWATGAGELGQLLFLSCPSERRGQPRTAAAHGPHHSLGKDLRGPALPLTSSAPACGLVPLGAGVGHPRLPCCQGLLAPASIAPMPAAKAVGRACSLQQPRAKGEEVPPQHFLEEGCASKLAKPRPRPRHPCQRPSGRPNLCGQVPSRAWVGALVPSTGKSLQDSFKSQTSARHISGNPCLVLLLPTNCPRVPLAKLPPPEEVFGNEGGGPTSPKPQIFLWCPCKPSVAISAGNRVCSVCTKRKVHGRCTFLTRGGKETEKAKTHDVGLLFAPNTGCTRFYRSMCEKKKRKQVVPQGQNRVRARTLLPG